MTLLKYAHKKRNNFVRHFKESVLAIKNDVYFLKKYKTVNTEYLSRSQNVKVKMIKQCFGLKIIATAKSMNNF